MQDLRCELDSTRDICRIFLSNRLKITINTNGISLKTRIRRCKADVHTKQAVLIETSSFILALFACSLSLDPTSDIWQQLQIANYLIEADSYVLSSRLTAFISRRTNST